MTIPNFDMILGVLPPHLGDPRDVTQLSPYKCTMTEVCERFATSKERIAILEGVLSFREQLLQLGIKGFQWLDGSFLEDIETQENRPPNDIDMVTFVAEPIDTAVLNAAIIGNDPTLLIRAANKAKYHIDHFWMPLGSPPDQIVEHSRYWYGLFSHRRDRQWKGMLRVELVGHLDDVLAKIVLGGKP